jgi:peptidoglycan/xylan/chitin deacetylase (PgdA/CDA1 family)
LSAVLAASGAFAAAAAGGACAPPPVPGAPAPPTDGAGELTTIARWQDGKAAAVSLTYDDGSANQFRVALPIMARLGLPATFFVITGDVVGSSRPGRFVGRPFADILEESARSPTSAQNFLERATAVRYAPYEGARQAHAAVGALYDDGKRGEAYRALDDALAKMRAGAARPAPPAAESGEGGGMRVDWSELRAAAAAGNEIASHTVSHPYLSLLDEPNLVRELEDSRDELREQLGPKHTFSIECPYGIEDPRALRYALARYPLARNRIEDPEVDNIDRASDRDPAASAAQYVFWQRGPLRGTPLARMEEWVDRAVARENVWLVLVFHGIEGLGWEALPREEVDAYLTYVAERRERLWVATFQDAGKYVRERTHARVATEAGPDHVVVRLSHDLDRALYDVALTLVTRVPPGWAAARVEQGGASEVVAVRRAGTGAGATAGAGAYVMYRARPNGPPIVLRAAN